MEGLNCFYFITLNKMDVQITFYSLEIPLIRNASKRMLLVLISNTSKQVVGTHWKCLKTYVVGIQLRSLIAVLLICTYNI